MRLDPPRVFFKWDNVGIRIFTYFTIAVVGLFVWFFLLPLGMGVEKLYGWIWGHPLHNWEDARPSEYGHAWTLYGSYPHWAKHVPLGIALTLAPVLSLCDLAAASVYHGMNRVLRNARHSASQVRP